MSVSVQAAIKGNVNKFWDQALRDIRSLGAVNEAVIFNDSGKDVTFYVYNYIDTVNWIPAQEVLVASGYYGSVAASGSFFKIHPVFDPEDDDEKDVEFLVAPGKAYVYGGPGKLEVVEKK